MNVSNKPTSPVRPVYTSPLMEDLKTSSSSLSKLGSNPLILKLNLNGSNLIESKDLENESNNYDPNIIVTAKKNKGAIWK